MSSVELIDIDNDITELTTLLNTATRPNVRQLLESNLRTLQSRKQSISSSSSSSSSASSTRSISTTISNPSSVTGPSPVPLSSTSSTVAPTSSNDTVYTPVEKFGWEQNNEYVTVLAYDLPEVGKIKDSVTCQFTNDTFDLIIPNLHGKNYRLRVLNLDKDILPEESKIKVKKNSIDILLRKKGKYDHWMELSSKKTKDTKKKQNDDPGAGITDMLKQMYDDGDDNMKKVIAEAFVKSREEQHKNKLDGGIGRQRSVLPKSNIGSSTTASSSMMDDLEDDFA